MQNYNKSNSSKDRNKSKVLKLGILASGNGTNFKSLIKESIRTNNFKISLLIVNKENCGAVNLAKSHGVEYLFLDHRLYKNREEYDKIILYNFKNSRVDAIIMAGWMRIVTHELIEGYQNRIVNIHPSLLPSFKGIDAIRQCIKAGVKISGCTVHLVTKEIDSGEIIGQAAVPVYECDSVETLHHRIQTEEHRLLPECINYLRDIWLN